VNIDIGEVIFLHMPTVVEAPAPDIYIGRRRRPLPGPPTTRALSDALVRWATAERNGRDGGDAL
jgi:hypothetical protein